MWGFMSSCALGRLSVQSGSLEGYPRELIVPCYNWATMKAGTEWNEERNENQMWPVNYHARHAETEDGLDWSGLDSPKTGKMPFSV